MPRLHSITAAAAAASVALSATTATAQRPELRFNANGEFKILQLADTQVNSFLTDSCRNLDANDGRYPCNAYNTTRFVERLIDAEQPDLIVFTGDNVSGPWDPNGTYQLLFQPVIASGVPFAAVFGNHDAEGLFNNRQFMDWLVQQPNSVSEYGENNLHGVGNYMLDIMSKDNGNTPAFRLWMLDSGDYSTEAGIPGYDWVWLDQIAWYDQASREAEARDDGRDVNSMAFFHIPTPEWWEAAEGPIVGDMYEGVYSPNVNSGLLTAMKQRDEVRAISVGHDHVNDWCGTWNGMNLCYGGGVGFTTYGRAGWERRARVFTISETTGEINTHKRLSNSALTTKDPQTLWPLPAPQELYCDGWTAPSSCWGGCAKWDDMRGSHNSRSQSAVNAKFLSGSSPDSRCCARPVNDPENQPWCFCANNPNGPMDASWAVCSQSKLSKLQDETTKAAQEGRTVHELCKLPPKPGHGVKPARCQQLEQEAKERRQQGREAKE